MSCTCVTFDPKDTGVRQCPEHYHIWRGARRLTSVGSIIRASFPLDPSIPPDVLENARDRGSQTDTLFAQYCLGTLEYIPSGTRQDVFKESAPYDGLLQKLIRWFDKQNFKKVEVQVLLGSEDHGGVLDFLFDGVPCDLKCTYSIEHTSRLQVAAYCDLEHTCLEEPSQGYILHVTECIKDATTLDITYDDFRDWRRLLDYWRMCQRRRNGKR